MKVISLVFSIGLCVPAVAQSALTFVSAAGPKAVPHFTLATKPPSTVWVSLSDSQQEGRDPGDGTVIHRIVTDLFRRTYSAYDLVLEARKDDPESLLATVRPQSETYSRRPGPEWTFVPPPSFPAPRVVQDGDTLEVGVFMNPDTGQQVVDTVTFDVKQGPMVLQDAQKLLEMLRQAATTQPASIDVLRPIPVREAPANHEPPVEFRGEDSDMRIWHPSAIVNGNPGFSARSSTADGPLPWFYLPGRGRYVLSLLPRQGAGFIKAGEIRGSTITIVMGSDTIELWTDVSVASGDSPYFLYVLHDSNWEPTSSSQRSRFLLGTVDLEEVEAMSKK
jgi:hypothetical protein